LRLKVRLHLLLEGPDLLRVRSVLRHHEA
jgi:hypothetical protein